MSMVWETKRIFHSNRIGVSEPLYRHLKNQNIEFLQFAFRWMNNLLMRELPMRCTIRLWDTYLVGEVRSSKNKHSVVCLGGRGRFFAISFIYLRGIPDPIFQGPSTRKRFSSKTKFPSSIFSMLHSSGFITPSAKSADPLVDK